ncbi:uncharacterized protein N7487_009340 [Penicillium crustosum]|uniref:uncharacterized protein n=1 Tax=Penicillium crustosum TaxID=36656 RepID=UPI0023A4C183|nr:uncharacterized protein N7487_009340 [Penicillium crustosum]KAJ5395037.1 hypothetical protein N7487_009340 [Penicillium crustosum]
MENLSDQMRNASLGDPSEDPNHLLFKPQAGSGLAPTALDEIPRGTTNGMWVRSESAYQNRNFFTEDIFFNLDDEKRTTIARTLNLHLRWWYQAKNPDKFVSWTSSLPFAIQYIYYRHLSPDDGSSLEDIKLYVIDTTQFPRGTFLRDLDLMNAFGQYDDRPSRCNLESFRNLRHKPSYDFGEYLSQGSLNIEGKREIISATSLFEGDRLRRLQPHFRVFDGFPFKDGKPVWASEVIRLRYVIWHAADIRDLSPEEMEGRLEAVKEIVQDLEPSWRYPLAIYFTSLIGSGSPNTETGRVATAAIKIRGLHIDTISPDNGHALVVADPNELLDRTGQTLIAKLRSVQDLCETVISTISSNTV